MRASPASRTRRFQAEVGLLPPLLWHCVVSTLDSLGVETVQGETEADSLVAEYAETLGGYAVSNDSDYFVLCGRGCKCKGYVQLDSIEYLIDLPASASQAPEEQMSQSTEDDGFEQVGRKGKARSRKGQPAEAFATRVVAVHPPSEEVGTLAAVRFISYSSPKLAAQLQLPLALLPLLAALVGNDYTGPSQASVLFRNMPSGAERIQEVAQALRTEWRAIGLGNQSRDSRRVRTLKGTNGAERDADTRSETGFSVASSATATPTRAHQQAGLDLPADPVRAMVEAVVGRMLARADVNRSHYVATGELEAIVDAIIDSVCTYSLLTHSAAPHLSSPSAAFFKPTSSESKSLALAAYQKAFRRANFNARLVEALTLQVFITRQFAEDPDVRSVHVGMVRTIRAWTYAALFSVWGMGWARESMEEPPPLLDEDEDEEQSAPNVNGNGKPKRWIGGGGYAPGEDPEDLIDVETPPSSLSGAGTEDEEDSLPSRPGSVAGDAVGAEEGQIKPPPAVCEYVRKGDRLVGELVRIPSLAELLRGESDHQTASDNARAQLPTSLADLLGQYEAASTADAEALDRERRGSVPTSDPSPPPTPLLPLATRFDLYLHSLHAHTERVRALPQEFWPLAASMRFIIIEEAERLGESRKRWNWNRAEVTAAVRAGCAARRMAKKPFDVQGAYASSASAPTAVAYPTTRNIHLSTMIQLVLEGAHHFAQSLLLTPEPLPLPHTLHDGPLFHTFLASAETNGDDTATATVGSADHADVAAVLDAVLHGLDDLLAIDVEEQRRERKAEKRREAKRAAAAAHETKQAKAKRAASAPKNAFALLGEQEDEDEE